MEFISVIIVNWNGKHLLDDCLRSILAQTYRNYEIIVVDNGSHDGSVEYIAAAYPSVVIVPLTENRGFTGGNIAGLQQAKGRYIVLLNNDALLCQDWIVQMVTALEGDESVGYGASKILIAGTSKIDSAGDCFTTAFNGTKIGEYEEESTYTERRYIPGACAAAVIYKRKMLDEIGFLDDEFFFNHEDTDLNLRAWLAGWKCIFVPEAVVYHKVSATVGEYSSTAVYYFARNIEWVWIKNIPLNLILRYLPQKLIYEIASFGFFCILKKKWRPFMKGKIDAFLKLPSMLKKRKIIQRSVKLTDPQIKRELMPILKYIKGRLGSVSSPK